MNLKLVHSGKRECLKSLKICFFQVVVIVYKEYSQTRANAYIRHDYICMHESSTLQTTSQESNLIKVTQPLGANQKFQSQIFILRIQSCFHYIKKQGQGNVRILTQLLAQLPSLWLEKAHYKPWTS